MTSPVGNREACEAARLELSLHNVPPPAYADDAPAFAALGRTLAGMSEQDQAEVLRSRNTC